MSHPSTPESTTGESLPGRRGFFQGLLRWGTIALGVLATVALGVPLVGYLLGALFKREEKWIALGRVAEFPVGQTRMATFVNSLSQPWDGVVANTACFVCNLGKDEHGQDHFRVLAVNCAHLGCPVSWFPQSGLFLCPCHGGVYYENGQRASGPPPRGLFHCEVRTKDGRLEIQAPHLPTLNDTLKDEAKRDEEPT